MSGLNKAMIIGNLGQDPELRYTPSGVAVANFSVATSEKWKDKDGNDQEKTEWHRVVIWRKLAEICGEYLKKGSKVYLEGKLQTRSWEDDNGVKRYATEIVVNQMQMLDRKASGATPPAPDDSQAPPASTGQNTSPEQEQPKEAASPVVDKEEENDLPF